MAYRRKLCKWNKYGEPKGPIGSGAGGVAICTAAAAMNMAATFAGCHAPDLCFSFSGCSPPSWRRTPDSMAAAACKGMLAAARSTPDSISRALEMPQTLTLVVFAPGLLLTPEEYCLITFSSCGSYSLNVSRSSSGVNRVGKRGLLPGRELSSTLNSSALNHLQKESYFDRKRVGVARDCCLVPAGPSDLQADARRKGDQPLYT